MSATRPEHIAPPDVYYNEAEAKKYGANSRMLEIQTAMSERAIELLQLPEDRSMYLLDIGCGSGLSGEVLSERGHVWVGLDISQAMLGVALEREVEGDLVYSDMGDGLPFRPGSFDGAVSISALQWLCNADKKHHEPKKRALKFFHSLYACLTRGAKAVFQFYPESNASMELLTTAAMKAGFSGGMVVDYPHSTKAKKYFLVLFAGEPNSKTRFQQPKGLDGIPPEEAPRRRGAAAAAMADSDDDNAGGDNDDDEKKKVTTKSAGLKSAATAAGTSAATATTPAAASTFQFTMNGTPATGTGAKDQKQDTVLFTAAAPQRIGPRPRRGERAPLKSRNWVQRKKDKQRAAGKAVAHDSKYTGRKRAPKF